MPNTISSTTALTKRSKVIAINTVTGEVRKDMGSSGPRIYTIESTDNNEIKLFQVGTYEVPLKFSMDGLPYLAEHSRSSMTYKSWQNHKIEAFDPNVFSKQQSDS
jgi:hypothetical protein